MTSTSTYCPAETPPNQFGPSHVQLFSLYRDVDIYLTRGLQNQTRRHHSPRFLRSLYRSWTVCIMDRSILEALSVSKSGANPPPLPMSLRERKRRIALAWTLIVLDSSILPLIVFYGLWYGSSLTPSISKLDCSADHFSCQTLTSCHSLRNLDFCVWLRKPPEIR